MRYGTPEAFRDALEQRLRNEARESGTALMRLRKQVAFERFLARLAAAAPLRWVLKGAFALELRFGLRTRTTKDIDLAGAGDEDAATEDLQAAARTDLGDFFSFRVRRTPALDDGAGFHAVRYTVASELAGRHFEQFPLDVALGEAETLEPDNLRGPGALGFAGIEAPQLPVVALEQHIAEKVHAYTGSYGAQQHQSTRAKDLVRPRPDCGPRDTRRKTTATRHRGNLRTPGPPAAAQWPAAATARLGGAVRRAGTTGGRAHRANASPLRSSGTS